MPNTNELRQKADRGQLLRYFKKRFLEKINLLLSKFLRFFKLFVKGFLLETFNDTSNQLSSD